MSEWVTIPEELVEDKPLPSPLIWWLKEDSNRFASIRTPVAGGYNLLYGLRKRGSVLEILGHKEDGGNEQIAEAATIEEAVNYIYTRAMLGE